MKFRLLICSALILGYLSFDANGQKRYVYVKLKNGASPSIISNTAKKVGPSSKDKSLSVRNFGKATLRSDDKFRSKFLKDLYTIELSGDENLEALKNALFINADVQDVVIEPKEQLLLVPNDPQNSLQDYLAIIKAYDAWNVTKGNPDIIIAISDNGVDYDHEDLTANHYLNLADPIDGLDNDGNGRVDDYYGYDIADGDNDPSSSSDSHGTMVAGIASASANNGTGIAGVGYNSSYYPIKVFRSSTGLSFGTYESITYAAELGIDVINLSWGSVGTYSETLQDIINSAVLENDLVIVAAAGNTNAELDFYPASYDNVLSVGASDNLDQKAGFATYSYHIDLMAPGVATYSTRIDDQYGTDQGSSFAAPQVAGTAALVRAEFPELDAVQVMERIRVTTDDIYDVVGNSGYYGQLGTGRLNVFRAVSEENLASTRCYDHNYSGKFGPHVFFGDTVDLRLDFVNILRPLENARVSISSPSVYAEFINNEAILGSLGTYDSIKGVSVPIVLSKDTPPAERIVVRIDFEDDRGYTDFQYVTFTTAADYLQVGNGEFDMIASQSGGLGHATNAEPDTSGLFYGTESIARYLGLMMGNDEDSISDNVVLNYSTGLRGEDLLHSQTIRYFDRKDVDKYARNVLNDSGAVNIQGLVVEEEFLAFNDPDSNQFLIVEYYLSNATDQSKMSMNLGLFLDPSLADSTLNFVAYNADNNLGYAYTAEPTGLKVGITILTGHSSTFHAIDLFDNDGNPIEISGNNISEANKYSFMTVEKLVAGDVGGGDVGMTLTANIGELLAGESEKIAFALVFGTTESELIENVVKAQAKYDGFVDKPDHNWTVLSCVDELVELMNENEVKLYEDPLGLIEIDQGNNLFFNGFANDSSFFYREVVNGYETDLYELIVDIANPEIAFRMDPEILYLDEVPGNRVQFIDLSLGAVSWDWSFSNGSFSSVKNPFTTFNTEGIYDINLSVGNALGCSDSFSGTFEVIERGDPPIIEDQMICEGTTVTLLASNSNSLRFYESMSHESPFHEGNSWTSTPINESRYYYVSSTAEAIESARVAVWVQIDSVKADFSYQVDLEDLTSSESMIILDNSRNSEIISWLINGELVSNESNLSIDYGAMDTLTMIQEVTSPNSCQSTLTIGLSLSKSPKPGVIAEEVCQGSEIEVSPLNGDFFVFYSDEALTNIVAKGTKAILPSINSDTVFYITNISKYLESDHVEFEVKIAEYNPKILFEPDSLLYGTNPNVQLSTDDLDIEEYQWYVNGEFREAVKSPLLTFDSIGRYEVMLVAGYDGDCYVNVVDEFRVYQFTDVEDVLDLIQIFPNPVYSELEMRVEAGLELSQIQIFDTRGVPVFKKISRNFDHTIIDLNPLPQGLYLLSGLLNDHPFQFKIEKK